MLKVFPVVTYYDGDLCRQEAEVEDHHAVVVLVCGKTMVVQHLVGQLLRNVALIELQCLQMLAIIY